MMRRVIVESPYAGNVERNLKYLRAALADCFARDEAPFASHGLYTQEGVLKDEIPADRERGIAAGFEWMECADMVVVYTDLGISKGMKDGMAQARRFGLPVEERSLPGWDQEMKRLVVGTPIGEMRFSLHEAETVNDLIEYVVQEGPLAIGDIFEAVMNEQPFDGDTLIGDLPEGRIEVIATGEVV